MSVNFVVRYMRNEECVQVECNNSSYYTHENEMTLELILSDITKIQNLTTKHNRKANLPTYLSVQMEHVIDIETYDSTPKLQRVK